MPNPREGMTYIQIAHPKGIARSISGRLFIRTVVTEQTYRVHKFLSCHGIAGHNRKPLEDYKVVF